MYFHNSLIPRGAYFLLPLKSKQDATWGGNFTKCISEVKVNQLKVKYMHVRMGISTFNMSKYIVNVINQNSTHNRGNFDDFWRYVAQTLKANSSILYFLKGEFQMDITFHRDVLTFKNLTIIIKRKVYMFLQY